jgi:lipopolysaccharide/colanic/teichoic acid biosynthesis glycosyltransferase/capsular polysaccharide biosynthesis protein
MIITFDLNELVQLIKKRFCLIFLVMTMMSGLGFLYSKVLVSEEYRSYSPIFFQNLPFAEAINKINEVRYYLLEKDEWIVETLKSTGQKVTLKAIDNVQRHLMIERVPAKGYANLLVQTQSRKETLKLTQAIAKVVREKVADIEVEKPSEVRVIPSAWKRITALSLFFGALLGYFVAVVLEVYNLRFDPEKMEKLLQQKQVLVRHANPLYFLLKRSIDLVLGSVGLVVFFIIYLLLIIPYSFGENKGPLLFKQRRYGVDGSLFSIYKFRSMRMDAEDVLKANPKLYQQYIANDYKLPLDGDPRITRLGRFLRRTSIDEFPQFINVVRGDMSMVGPRPIITEEIKEYGDKAEIFFSMKPGIAGVWGVSGRSNIMYPDRVDVELSYLAKRSFKFDMLIISKTFFKVLEKDGAY